MLAGVANDENTVIRIQLVEKGPHLVAAGKARLIEHIEMPVGRVGAGMVRALGKKALERGRLDASLAELARRLGSWGEALDLIPARFRAFTDGLERRCLA